ncbi:uncharacterized protein SAPINGB_P006138 [Magnusiomyces paraingens]|uniref:DUF676 domain-containing protein n=1 Tax=Magnusiomyces paraingens TaxID=2606893 RepID=A0A5E8C4M2_9ASCO|nr:uncharacterized protein SAPINGB_P006138 [Saprochaete ingens]VVT58302.1 unnamed protein product [Saprochaete ingens]
MTPPAPQILLVSVRRRPQIPRLSVLNVLFTLKCCCTRHLSDIGKAPQENAPHTVSATPKPRNKQIKQDLVAEFRDLRPTYLAPKDPVVLCHGLFGFDSLTSIKYWRGIQESLEASGVQVYTAAVAPTATIELRAKYLERAILLQIVKPLQDNACGAPLKGPIYINLVGHSMGGLDARYYISKLLPRYNELARQSGQPERASDTDEFTRSLVQALDLGSGGGGGDGKPWTIPIPEICVRSLTTISTPHRGSSFADHLMASPLSPARVPGLYKLLPSLGFDYAFDRNPYSKSGAILQNEAQAPADETTGAFRQLTRAYLTKTFNPNVPDDPSVAYFSYGSAYWPQWWHMNLFFGPAQKVIYSEEGPNDGLVSVASARWGHYLGTIENVNHLDLINWPNSFDLMWAHLIHRKPPFNAIAMYLSITDMLAREGF